MARQPVVVAVAIDQRTVAEAIDHHLDRAGKDRLVDREADHRGDEQRGVGIVGADILRVVAVAGMHALAVDPGDDGVPRLAPVRPLAEEPDGAVDRDPVHDRGVQVVLLGLPRLPQAGILLVPVGGGEVGEANRLALHRPGDRAAEAPVHVEQVEHLAVGVALVLLGGLVAVADRGAAAPALEMRRLVLGEVGLAGDGVEGLEAALVALGERADEAEERFRLRHHAEFLQHVEGQAGVADPAEPVVPVADAADLLRQRGGGRRHDGAGRRVGQGLEGERAAQELVGERPVIGGAGRPAGPGPARRLHQGAGAQGLGVARAAGIEREGLLVPVLDREQRHRLGALDRERQVGDQVRQAIGPGAARDRPQRRKGLGEAGERPVDHPHRHPAGDAGDEAHEARQRPPGLRGQHHVVDGRRPGGAGEGGLQDVGAGQVEPGALGRDVGREREEAAACAVEEAREDRGRVEALEAGPVDRAVAGDEGAAVAVADEPVGLDGLVGPRVRIVHRERARARGGWPARAGPGPASRFPPPAPGMTQRRRDDRETPPRVPDRTRKYFRG